MAISPPTPRPPSLILPTPHTAAALPPAGACLLRRELLSLLNSGTSNPAIDTSYFPGTTNQNYWSNDTYTPIPADAWYVEFVNGLTNPQIKTYFVNAVRLVHGTQLAQGTFMDNGDGTVTDTVMGLMWDQCSQGQSGAACATGAASFMSWSAALSTAVTANSANYKGHNDWRLPNKNELETLVVLTNPNPTIDLTAFPATPQNNYWSSTTETSFPANAWYVDADGRTYPEFKVYDFAVRLVRGGQ